ncbi:MAG: hypothetical protein ACM3OB_05670 [Acidobacteriota bacterium]
MRTTLTLDDDVAAALERRREKEKKPFKQVVNETLRRGLAQPAARRRRPQRFETAVHDLGPCLLPSLDNIGDVLDWLDEHEAAPAVGKVATRGANRSARR